MVNWKSHLVWVVSSVFRGRMSLVVKRYFLYFSHSSIFVVSSCFRCFFFAWQPVFFGISCIREWQHKINRSGMNEEYKHEEKKIIFPFSKKKLFPLQIFGHANICMEHVWQTMNETTYNFQVVSLSSSMGLEILVSWKNDKLTERERPSRKRKQINNIQF